MGGKFTIDMLQEKLLYINPNIDILSTEYISAKNNYLEIRCKLHPQYVQYSTWSNLKSGYGCKYCGKVKMSENRKIDINKTVSVLRPDLVKYFKDKSLTNTLYPKSSKSVELICPNCDSKRSMKVHKLSNNCFNCDICSDNISLPEKFVRRLLKEFDMDFTTEYTIDNKRYDFYFELNDDKYIIETHGLQHYEESSEYSKFSRTLKEEQENDLLKYNLAIKRGILPENYIVIDCRYSELEWLKENCTKELSNNFDLSSVDWYKVWEYSQKSITLEIIESLKTNLSISKIADMHNVSTDTIYRILYMGRNVGLLDKNNRVKRRKVAKYDDMNNVIDVYESVSKAGVDNNLYTSNIIKSCKSDSVKSGGYRWRYVEEL